MNQLPLIDRQAAKDRGNALRVRKITVHLIRVSLVITILCCIRFAASRIESTVQNLQLEETARVAVEKNFPGGTIKPYDLQLGGYPVQGSDGAIVGYLLQTSPIADDIIGYSGPTNVLLTFNSVHQIRDATILKSADTREHVEAVKNDAQFLASFRRINANSENDWDSIDVVSGATLTCRAIVASVAVRLGDEMRSIKFQLTPELANVRKIFPAADKIRETKQPSLFAVLDAQKNQIGTLLTTTPSGDNIVGYQGPTATLVGFDTAGLFSGLAIDQSYDNEKYVGYVEEDYHFPSWFEKKQLADIARMDSELVEIEGVSGATMTSMAVAEGIVTAARTVSEQPPQTEAIRSWSVYLLDGITILLTIVGIVFSFTGLSKSRWFRLTYQITVVVVIGFVSGHILSQALFIGWATHGLPWRIAPGLVLLTVAAFTVPIVSKQQPYCHHICPFGAMQQWMRRGRKIRLSRKWSRRLKQTSGCLILGLLGLSVWTGVVRSDFNLAAIEPFHAFTIRVAGLTTLTLFVIGLAGSFFLPMAYCRYGCPTGRLLGFLRFNSNSHQLGLRDLGAALLTSLAILLLFAK